jgi:hypothetical protein
MLRTGAQSGHEQRGNQRHDGIAEAGKNITEAGERRAERKHGGRSETLGKKAGRNLEPGQRAGKHRLHQTKHGVAEPKLALPDRQHDVDEIGIAIV